MTDVDPPETASTRRWRLFLIGSLLVFGLLVGGIAVTRLPSGQGSPVSAVEGYLDALLAGDAEAALGYVSAENVPTGPEAGFLTDEALTGGWSVAAIERTDKGGDAAEVEVTFSTPGAKPRGVFQLSSMGRKGDWWLDFPFETVAPAGLPFDYLAVDGLAVDRSLLLDGAYVFPGLYRFYDDAPGVEPVGGERTAVFPDGDGDDRDVPLETVTATSGTVDEVRDRLGRLLDECIEAASTNPYGCPFGAGRIEDPVYPPADLERVQDVAWELEKPPGIDLVPHPDGDAAFAVATTSPGSATVTGTGWARDDELHDFRLASEVSFEDFTVTLGRDGTVIVTDPDRRRI